MALRTTSHVFDPRPNYPFRLTAKRYWHPPTAADDGLTLILTHGTSFMKEAWEPTLDEMYEMLQGGFASAARGGGVKVRELWGIDCPNHGEAAYLNERILRYGYDDIFGWEVYAQGIHALLAGLGTGIDVDFSKRTLVGVGHSMGAISLMLSTTFYPPLNYQAFYLVEPMLLPVEPISKGNFLEKGAVERRDIWPSKENAYNSFKRRSPWKDWDERVLKIYVDVGLRPLPTLDYPDKSDGVTLTCSRIQEAACYRDRVGWGRGYVLLSHLTRKLPIHIIYGAVDDYVQRSVKDDIVHNATGGIDKLASLHRVEGAGHLVVHVNPRGLAKTLLLAMTGDVGEVKGAAKSRISPKL